MGINLISKQATLQLGVAQQALEHPILARALDGYKLRTITLQIVPSLRNWPVVTATIPVDNPFQPLILGLLRFSRQNPCIHCAKGVITEWNPAFLQTRLTSTSEEFTSATSESSLDLLGVPLEYHAYWQVFSKIQVSPLPIRA